MATNHDAKEAIRELFDLYADGIYRYVSYMLPSHFDAKDVVQEVFLRAYQSWNGVHQKASARAWLYTIARNHAFDLLRKHRSEHVILRRFTSETARQYAGLESTVEYDELIRQLPDRYRQILVLRGIDGLSTSETAKVMGVTESFIRINYHRAKKKFGKLLLDESPSFQPRGETI